VLRYQAPRINNANWQAFVSIDTNIDHPEMRRVTFCTDAHNI
jgi:hypothetical protein